MSVAIIGKFMESCIAMSLKSQKYFRKFNVIASSNVFFAVDLLFLLHPKIFNRKYLCNFGRKG
jgi:hypothetical protein